MSGIRRALGFALLIPLAVTSAAEAQRRPIELGIDAMFAYHNPAGPDNNVFAIDGPLGGFTAITPVNGLRAAFPVNEWISLEPSVGFNLMTEVGNDFEDEETMSRFGFATSVLIHRSSDVDRVVPFLGVGGNVTRFDWSESDAMSQFGAYGFVGVNLPIVERLAVRTTLGGGHFFENDDLEARWTGFGTIGLSFWPGAPTPERHASR